MNITLRQLETFREVMRSGSISQAARSVGRTQPAVSSMVSNLESELGFLLFVREHGKLTPTPEAKFFLEETDAILERIDRTERTVERIRHLEEGKLRVASHPAASSVFLPKLLTEFLKDKTNLEVVLTMRSSDVVEDLIASQQYDIGFSETPKTRTSIEQDDFDLECVCMMPANSELARKSIITPHDLHGKPMAILFDEHTTAKQTKAVFKSEGCDLHKKLELRTFLPGLQFVGAGSCYMICDMITAYSYVLQHGSTANLTIRSFRPRISNSVSVLTPGYATQAIAAQKFRSNLIEAIQVMQTEIEQMLKSEKYMARAPTPQI